MPHAEVAGVILILAGIEQQRRLIGRVRWPQPAALFDELPDFIEIGNFTADGADGKIVRAARLALRADRVEVVPSFRQPDIVEVWNAGVAAEWRRLCLGAEAVQV